MLDGVALIKRCDYVNALQRKHITHKCKHTKKKKKHFTLTAAAIAVVVVVVADVVSMSGRRLSAAASVVAALRNIFRWANLNSSISALCLSSLFGPDAPKVLRTFFRAIRPPALPAIAAAVLSCCCCWDLEGFTSYVPMRYTRVKVLAIIIIIVSIRSQCI